MPISTPEPRLPLEPEEYPLYRPPSRIGCSAMTIITLVTVLTFALLLWRVTPQVSENILSFPRDLLGGGSSSDEEIDSTPGTGGLPTQTVISAEPVTPTVAVVVNPTPVIEYVQVANTGGAGVRLRAEPQDNARNVVTVGEGAVFKIIGPDTNNASGTWRRVELPGDGRNGYVLSKYLIPSTGP